VTVRVCASVAACSSEASRAPVPMHILTEPLATYTKPHETTTGACIWARSYAVCL